MTSTASASNHPFTCGRLSNLLTETNPVKRSSKPSGDSLKEILELIEPNHTVSDPKCNKINDAMAGSYTIERDFDTTLFAALKKDLEDAGAKLKTIKEEKGKIKWMIVDSEHLKCGGYAFGFARQAQRCTEAIHHKTDEALSPNINKVESERNEPDHCCCIFENNENDWEISAVLSVVELKMSDTSGTGKEGDEKLLTKEAFIQAISYVFESSWPDICKHGLVDHDLKWLPIAMIAAQKTKNGNDMPSQKFRWKKASLLIPEWGGQFQLEYNGSKKFTKEGAAANIDQDLATTTNLYMETMLFGIKLWGKYREIFIQNNEMRPFPSPLSGLPPQEISGYDYCGSPLLSKSEVERFNKLEEKKSEAQRKPKYAISQGDLFYFKKLDLNKIGHKMYLQLWDGDGSDEEGDVDSNKEGDVDSNKEGDVDSDEESFVVSNEVDDVFVKVWSSSAHRKIQDLAFYWIALDTLKTIILKQEHTLLDLLSKVYIGTDIRKTGNAMSSWTVTRKIYGHALKPSDDTKVWLWDLFKTLCREILLPLAGEGLVHQDLRVGFDCTYNILIGKTSTDNKEKMRLIDYESLCIEKLYSVPETAKRYPIKSFPGKEELSAYDFLFQQCVGVAYAWIAGIYAKDMDFSQALAWFGRKLENEGIMNTTDGCANENANYIKFATKWWVSKNRLGAKGRPTKKTKTNELRKATNVFEKLFLFIDKIFIEDSKKTPKQDNRKGHIVSNNVGDSSFKTTGMHVED